MTVTEARQLAASLVAQGARDKLTAHVEGDRIVFSGPGAQTGTHSLDIGTSSRDRVRAHWRGFVTTNGGIIQAAPTSVRKTPPAQLDREIASALRQPLRAPATGAVQPHVRRLVVVTYWGDPQLKSGGRQQLGELTRSDRYARAWLASSQRFAKYEIDTHDKGSAYSGGPVAPGAVPERGVKSVRPATLKDLKRFHFKLREGHTLADSAELDAERADNCAYCGKATPGGAQSVHQGIRAVAVAPKKSAAQLDREIAAALITGPAVLISVCVEDTDDDEDFGEEHYTLSDDGDEFDDAVEIRGPDVQGDIDERRLHYRALGRKVVLDIPAGRGWL